MSSGRFFDFPAWAVSCALTVVVACQGEREKPHAPKLPPRAVSSAATLSADAPSATHPPLPPLVAHELERLHATKLPWTAPREPLAGLAFGKACLAQAQADAVRFRDLKSGEPFAQGAVGAPRALAVRPGGGVLALGALGAARLEPNERSPHSLGSVAFLPGSWLLPDLEDPARFYIFYAGQRNVYRYDTGGSVAGMLPIAEQLALDDYAGPLTLTRDGAFVYGAEHGGLRRSAPHGSRTSFALPAGRSAAWRLLPAERLDEVWSIGAEGDVARVQLARGLPVRKSFRLGGQPFDAAVNHDSLAFIVTSMPDGGSRSWALSVLDFEGHERFHVSLPAPDIGTGDSWFGELARNEMLALSSFAPLVAVGGQRSLVEYDYQAQALVFAR